MKQVEWNEEFGTGGTVICICDNCKTEKKYKFKSHPYREAMEKLKKTDWVSRKLGDDWYDFCSNECFDQFR